MKGIVRVLIVLAGIGLAALAGAYAFRVQIAEAGFRRAVAANVGRDASAGLEDGLHVFMCGAGSPMPDPQRAGPCMAILAGERAFVIDAGTGGVRNMARMGFPTARLERVLLTHLHSDHIDGLGELIMQALVMGGRTAPLPVHGPRGTGEVVQGFNMAYRIDGGFRTAHHGAEIAPPAGHGGAGIEIAMPAGPGAQAVVIDEDGLKITAFAVSHAPIEPAFGYRIDYKDRSVVISGDTVYSDNLVRAAEGADVLFHEALNREMTAGMHGAAEANGNAVVAQILNDIVDYHATPEDAARGAAAAGAGQLVFHHTVPPLPARSLEAVFLKDARAGFDGPMSVSRDGLVYSLPAGAARVNVSGAFR